MGIDKLLFVGCGNMAGAMLEGWLMRGVAPSTFTIFDPGQRDFPAGVTALSQMPESGTFDAILLGVKPQLLRDVVPAVKPLAGPNTIVAGVELDVLKGRFPRAAGVVRIMPNLSVALGKSPLGLAEAGLDAGQREELDVFLQPLGRPEWIDEAQFDLFTALAGSGPAFVYRFIDALAKGAQELGFEREQAVRTATAMVEGASALASHSSDDPGTLADKVASPGGTTRAGLDVLDEGDAIAVLMERTLRAARDRSAQMAREARN
jgi:pyrroline-5-carboxylate reductase